MEEILFTRGINWPAIPDNVPEEVKQYIKSMQVTISDTVRNIFDTLVPPLSSSTAWNPGSIADGDMEAKDVTVTGAALGDYATASFSLDVTDLVLDAQVTAANTVTTVLSNNTGGAVDLGSGTLYVRVYPRE